MEQINSLEETDININYLKLKGFEPYQGNWINKDKNIVVSKEQIDLTLPDYFKNIIDTYFK